MPYTVPTTGYGMGFGNRTSAALFANLFAKGDVVRTKAAADTVEVDKVKKVAAVVDASMLGCWVQ